MLLENARGDLETYCGAPVTISATVLIPKDFTGKEIAACIAKAKSLSKAESTTVHTDSKNIVLGFASWLGFRGRIVCVAMAKAQYEDYLRYAMAEFAVNSLFPTQC